MYILDSVKMLKNTVAAENSVLIHPQEQAAKMTVEEERQKWVSLCVFYYYLRCSVKKVIYRRL